MGTRGGETQDMGTQGSLTLLPPPERCAPHHTPSKPGRGAGHSGGLKDTETEQDRSLQGGRRGTGTHGGAGSSGGHVGQGAREAMAGQGVSGGHGGNRSLLGGHGGSGVSGGHGGTGVSGGHGGSRL